MKYTLLLTVLCSFVASLYGKDPTPVLYNRIISGSGDYPELLTEDTDVQFTEDGLRITKKGGLVRLNQYYALAERLIRYHVRFSADAVGIFQSDQGDFKAIVDVRHRRISIGTDPISRSEADFLDPTHEYLVEVHRNYQTSTLRIVDLFTGEQASVEATLNGTGGVGAGAEGAGFFVGLQHDYYCFGLMEGTEMQVKQICVLAKETDLTLLIYGDSITEPEGYFPTVDFPQSWTQLIMKNVSGNAMASGRGGNTIHELLGRIKNELPYVQAKYVMITIGTNGGNTEENLSELVEYVRSQGSIPILNNIPCNESGTQIPVNEMIEKIRQKYGIKGCRFDLATSLAHDGQVVDKTTMYFEDYDWGKIYHHPNVNGSLRMYTRTLIDVPEIYE